ncbi:gamma-tubulin complex component 5-like [Saccoglossus kowalevskii]|uniref:Gamma-tubulin complex component n=1 Tax=Saccoglossus kowalevskii TaxID=10224 RepID=A0ABM0GVS7_SACKO|nr:PREDICTED: gamma-tubulin complex component 5-like [Saccoglossus kowalevskii]
MAYFDKRAEKDLKKLIKCLTGFQEGSDNFTLSHEFALSNFRFHRYLAVDSHKVTRQLHGVCEKFAIHSQPHKHEVFKRLTDKFLNSPLLIDQDLMKSDAHYGILSILMLLSESPVSHHYKEQVSKPKTEEKDNFDWTSYLLEGIEIPSFLSSDEEWSNDEAASEPEDEVQDSGIHVNESDDTLVTTTLEHSEHVEQHAGKDWISNNVVVQYWHGDVEKHVFGGHPTSSLAKQWDLYLYEKQPFHQFGSKFTMTETQVVRETIWLLFGMSDMFVYKYTDNKCTCNADIQVSHLTPNALYSLLYYFARYGQMVYHLHQFIEEIITHSGNIDYKVSQTFQAFASSLSCFLQQFKSELCIIEKDIMKQDKNVSLSELKERIQPQLEVVATLYDIYNIGVNNSNGNSAVLLTAFYNTLLELQSNTVENTDRLKVCTVLSIWLTSTQPFINIIDEWISNGKLVDPAKEFIISRNEEIQTNSNEYWEKGYTIYGVSAQQSKLQQQQFTKDTPSESVGIPGFLEPILYSVISAGKSMDLVASLGRLTEKKLNLSEGDRISLFESFTKSLYGVWDIDESEDIDESSDSDDVVIDISQQQLTEVNLLLQHDAKLQSKQYTLSSKKSFSSGLPHELMDVFTDRPLDIQLVMHRCLYPHIIKKCNRASSHLVKLLKTEYHLLDYLAAMRYFYLMEAGDAMYDFYTDVFERLRLQEYWQDVTYLTNALQEAVHMHHSKHMSRLTVSVEPVSKTKRLPINALDVLTLHYKVPWPVNVVLNPECQQIYNAVFRLLLQIKRAKYCLEQLRFSDLTNVVSPSPKNCESENQHLVHRIYLIRVQLLHFVDCLHNYIMTRILHTTGWEFQQQLDTAVDLNQLLDVHTHYVKTIYERCLLNKKMGYVREAIIKVLNLALNFQKRWDGGLHTITEPILDKMEEEFKKCHYFLSKLFANTVKRGVFPHLELLAQSLQTSYMNATAHTKK